MYFVCLDDAGLALVERESPKAVEWTEFKEIDDVATHVNEKGLAQLSAGETIYFDGQDQSYPELMSLFD